MATTLLEQTAEDIAGLYDPTFAFAETVTGPSGDFMGIFSKEYLQEEAGGSVVVSSTAPVLRSQIVDILIRGDIVTIRSLRYVVVEVQPNGFGEAIHRLQLT